MSGASFLRTSSVSDRSTSGSATSHDGLIPRCGPLTCHVDVFEELVDFHSQRFVVVAETAVVSRPMIVEDILGDVTCCCFHFDGELDLLL